LVPFGEYVPWRRHLPFIERYHVRNVDFAAGAMHRVLQAGIVAIGPMICFESIFPQISWNLTARGAQVLVVITNDAWFGHTAAAAQHRQIAVLRAVETNRWVLRAASTGISSMISPEGRIVAEAGLFERKVLSHEIRLGPAGARPRAPGSAFAWLMVFLSVAFLIAPAALPRRRKAARAARPSPHPRRPGRALPR
jgi:apolipoprotein N-acyltransferase